MKIFIDSADVEEIKKAAQLGILGGVTTNPTLIVKQLSSTINPWEDHKKILREICKISPVEILAEPISSEYEKIVQESVELAQISPNIVAKIPFTSEGLKAVKILKEKNIKTAFTLIFSVEQALISAVSGVDFICPFVGRLDDIGQVGTDLIKEIMKIYKNYNFTTKVIVASIRNVQHVLKSAEYGVYAVTIPPKLIPEMISHALTIKGIEKFIEDWNKIKQG